MSATELDKGYAAGFFDGEGSITIAKPRERRGYTVEIAIAQRYEDVLIWLQTTWGGSIRTCHQILGTCHRIKKWQCSSAKAAQFLFDVFPYLKGKQKIAKLALELQATKNHALRNTPEYLAFCESIRQSVMALNRMD